MTLRRRLRSLLGSRSEPQQSTPQRPTGDAVEGLKLNLGCGFDHREGWLNVDLHAWHKPDMVANVTNLSEIEDGKASYALAQDILEHIHRERCSTALREWNRVLKQGGMLDLRVPDVIALAHLMMRPDRQTEEQQQVLLRCMFGTQSYEGDFHLNGFTELSLKAALDGAGFEIVYLGHHDEWLLDVVARKVRDAHPDPLLRLVSDEEFLRQAYGRFLGRDPDPEGRAHFLHKLAEGAPRETVMATLRSAEGG